MWFFIKVCVLFRERWASDPRWASLTLGDFLDAFQRTGEIFGDNFGAYFPSCIPELAGFGGVRYPHEGILSRFREACARNVKTLLMDNPLWLREDFNRLTAFDCRSDLEVAAFTGELDRQLQFTAV